MSIRENWKTITGEYNKRIEGYSEFLNESADENTIIEVEKELGFSLPNELIMEIKRIYLQVQY